MRERFVDNVEGYVSLLGGGSGVVEALKSDLNHSEVQYLVTSVPVLYDFFLLRVKSNIKLLKRIGH